VGHEELQSAGAGNAQRQQFERQHSADLALVRPVDAELSHRLACRVEQRTIDPPASYVQILGGVPEGREALAAWKRGALILESHHLGVDLDPSQSERSSMLGSRSEAAALRAQLETLPHRTVEREPQAMNRDFEVGIGF
jgi:hypothetical protein